MIDALRFEWVRIRTLRSTYWLIGLAVLLSGVVALIIAVATRNDPDRLNVVTVGNILTGGGSFAIPFIPIFVAIIGVFATGHEYRHGTIQPTLMAIPQRSTLLIAKIVLVALAAIFAVALSVAINYVIGLLFWGEAPNLSQDPLNQALPGYVVYAILYTVLGLGARAAVPRRTDRIGHPAGLPAGRRNPHCEPVHRAGAGLAGAGREIPAVHSRWADVGDGDTRLRPRRAGLRLLQPMGIRRDLRDLRRAHPRTGLAALPEEGRLTNTTEGEWFSQPRSSRPGRRSPARAVPLWPRRSCCLEDLLGLLLAK